MQYSAYFKGAYKSLPVTCTGFGSGLLGMVFKYQLCTFKIMSRIIRADMQIYNSRNTRLGDALGCSLTCPWPGSPAKILVCLSILF